MTTHNRMTFTRRQALLGGTALLASAGLTGIHSHRASGLDDARKSRTDVGTDRERSRQNSASLPASSSADPRTPTPASIAPATPPRRSGWTGPTSPTSSSALRQVASTGLNTLKLSSPDTRERPTVCAGLAVLAETLAWRRRGTTEAEQIEQARQLFTTAAELDLVVAPMVEVGLNFFRFWQDFPFNLDELVRQAGWLLHDGNRQLPAGLRQPGPAPPHRRCG